MARVFDPETGETQYVFLTSEGERIWRERWSGLLRWCEHPETQVRIRTNADGRRAVRRQCLTCGRFSGGTLPAAMGIGAPDADEELADRYEQARRQARRDEEDAIIETYRFDYDGYLQTAEWREKRRQVMERDGGLCQGCRKRPAENVHHLTYDHVGEEFLHELIALCRRCHSRLHGHDD
jgi:hypothetical protein